MMEFEIMQIITLHVDDKTIIPHALMTGCISYFKLNESAKIEQLKEKSHGNY